MIRCITGITVICIWAGVTLAQQPIVDIKITPERNELRDSIWNKPNIIKSTEEAAKHFGKDALEKLGKEVDFEKQFLLVFEWKGSGGDSLSYAVAESFPEQIIFSLKRGLTRDLRSHTHIYALRSNVQWSAKEKADK